MKKPRIGSVSCDTTNPKHLIPAFLWELNYLGVDLPNLEGSPLYGLIDRHSSWIDSDSAETESYLDSDDCYWDLEAIIETLNGIAPDYAYFGAHEGDGSDYGFWPDWECIDVDIQYGGLPVSRSEGLWLEVNERGNATLWDSSPSGDSEEVWSCV